MGLDMGFYKVSKNDPQNYEEMIYFRKFNALHDYCVKKFQNGVDECQESRPITKEDIKQMIQDLKDDKLTPVNGFFFGPTEKDEWYYQQNNFAISQFKIIEKLFDFENFNFIYQSSW